MTDQPEPGLRERKRAQTRRAILVAAVRVAQEKGIDGATVDEISRRADVSPRTFFNYFASKDEALAGTAPDPPSEAAMEAFVAARGPVLLDLAELISTSVAEAVRDPELTRLRMALVKEHPHLVAVRVASLRHFEDLIVDVVERRLLAEHPDLASDPATADTAGGAGPAREQAAVLAITAAGLLRHAWVGWAHGDGAGTLADAIRRSAASLDEVIGRPSSR